MTRLKKSLFFIFFFLVWGHANPPDSHAIFPKQAPKEYDVVLLATPVGIHSMTTNETADAVEKSEKHEIIKHLAVFKIERILIGELAKTRRGGLSRMDQASEAAKNREFFKIAGFDFKNPMDLVNKELLRVAVKDAGVSFGLTPGEPLVYFTHKIYLKRVASKPEAFLFIKSQPYKK